MDNHEFFVDKALLLKAIGLPSCIISAPILLSEASHSTTDSLLKSSMADTGVLQAASLRASNAFPASSVINIVFLQ